MDSVSSGEASPAGVATKLARRLCGVPSIPREACVAMLLSVSRGESGVTECVACPAGEVCVGRGGSVEMTSVLLAVSPRGECVSGNAVSRSLEVGVSSWL